ncbi:glycine betaine/proline transport system ATP-binding protein [Chromobacterium alkanivorans]|uniref:quaternary amine ABC transporter ATP-binding protein n=1 Tax=Chromobacterium TaxID=535 RepID=UPI000653BFEB|nr:MULTISPECIES: glycine betaine/L-proline ABC transporter ATP-binding protein [Chromobacterium]KMN83813.1 glycine/betaine ABC transporter ATPase [Chromobacterium sp. LK11]MCS3806763.1 glycine betaine/proline transport system ATP-binding protein [Chromobacterium alkanivorans]MCS3821065.1 glycine betaine/proline transport system ATP-binding protein [Chromobacterium alkanivorans]MCS3876023.1 glycine betaine/proline transport system ATP-binding protein [Chromobacterium alkanivorans]
MQSGKIEVRNLYKVFGGKTAEVMRLLRAGERKDEVFRRTGAVVGVNDVSFSVQAGEIFVLMGLSGSGKSTLIRLINRLLEPSAGQILLDGQDLTRLTPRQLVALRRRDMSMVFQSFALMPHRTVLDNAAFGLEIAGVARKAREARALEVLEQVGLAPFAGKHPYELSGGMQQRVGLVRALAVNPSLMLMDEAFSALDPLKRAEMQDLLLQLQREQRRTIVFVSHDLEEALRIGSRIAIMEGGRLVQVGSPREIIERPADDYVRDFFKSVDTSRYLQAKDLIEAASPSRVDGAPHVAPSCSLSDVLQRLLGQTEPLLVRDDDGRCLGVITPSSVLNKLSQHRLSAAAHH